MKKINKYSIYPNNKIRIAFHCSYWIFLLFFLAFRGLLFVDMDLFWAILITSLVTVVRIIFIHYFLFSFIYPAVLKKEWIKITLLGIFLYVIIFIIIKFTLLFLNGLSIFKHIPLIDYKLFYFINLFSAKTFVMILGSTFWICLPGIAIKLIVNFYESSQEKLVIVRERNTMELNFLRTQIQPDFLFDIFNKLYELVTENTKAAGVVQQLSDLLRFSLYDSSKEEITLQEEKFFLINYILLEKVRHKESRVQICYDFNKIENPDFKIKPLILVNFIENAFKHGINATVGKSWTKILLSEEKGNLKFQISNSKPTFSIDKKKVKKDSGLGLINVRRRLDLEYNKSYTLDIQESENVFEIFLVIKL